MIRLKKGCPGSLPVGYDGAPFIRAAANARASGCSRRQFREVSPYPDHRRILVITGRYGEGLLTEPTGAAQPRRQDRSLCPKPAIPRVLSGLLTTSLPFNEDRRGVHVRF